jgi:polyisoprenyl-phosphate glycosyltransferase
MSTQTLAPPPAQLFDPDARRSGPSWAHVSGWAQLSGKRRTVSCIVPCHDTAASVAKLLPALSDTLTEYGYPWETIAVDCDPTQRTQGVLAPWIKLPGFRSLRCRGGTRRAEAVAMGLHYARGDVVLVADPTESRVPELVSDTISRWESGACLLLYSEQDTLLDASQMVRQEDGAPPQAQTRQRSNLRTVMSAVSLIDRRLVDRLLRDTELWASPR